MKHSTKQLVLASVLAALTCAATLVVTIPSPSGGFMNLGDTVVLLSAYLLGPLWGAAAAGIGSGMADLIAGYAAYVPATAVIKALMALCAASLYRLPGKTPRRVLLCGLAAESIMVLGYWCYDGFLMGSLSGAAVGIPSNLMQALFGLAASCALTAALRASGHLRRAFPDF